MEILQAELSDNKQEVDQLKSQLLKLQEYNIKLETQLKVCRLYYFASLLVHIRVEPGQHH